MKKVLFSIGFSLLIPFVFAVSVKAENSLFVSSTCPHCQYVEQTINGNGQIDTADITIREVTQVQENYQLYLAAIQVCGIDPENAAVPMLYEENKCYTGDTEVLKRIGELAEAGNSATTVYKTDNNEENTLPIVSPGTPKDEAKRNTLIFIGIMIAFLGGLVALGYWKQKSSGKTVEMSWAIALTLALISLNYVVLSNPLQAEAFCPVCTIAVGAGLGVSKSLGIDDVITSIWIGGLLISSSMWMIEWLDKKKVKFFFRKPLIYILMYGLVIWPLSTTKVIGATYNTLWGVDKVLLGIIIGTIGFVMGYIFSNMISRSNNGKVYFPFQKVVFPLSMLVLLSLVFFFIVY